jgi:hypothetical protein
MARFHDVVGYADDVVETAPGSGVWVDDIVEKPYFGDVLQAIRNLNADDKINEDITVTNRISIIADQYANENFLKIKYVKWSGVLWVVTTVEVRAPRLILSLGSVYNGPTPESPDAP